MPLGLQLGVDELSVYLDLEPSAVRRDQHEPFDHVFKLLEELTCQAHGPVGVVSDRAVHDLDLEHEPSQWAYTVGFHSPR